METEGWRRVATMGGSRPFHSRTRLPQYRRRERGDKVAFWSGTVKRRFRRLLNGSVHDEIMRVRMERVCELLTETEMPMA